MKNPNASERWEAIVSPDARTCWDKELKGLLRGEKNIYKVKIPTIGGKNLLENNVKKLQDFTHI